MTPPGVPPLEPAALRRRCDPAALKFETTAALEDLPELPGQERALGALRFGVGLRANDYNIFAIGPTGLGKHAAVRALLEARAAHDPTPDDWSYIHDFADRRAPRALRLPAGRAAHLRRGMDALVPELRAALRAMLEGDEFKARTRAIAETLGHEHASEFDEVEREATRRGLELGRGPDGFTLAPARDGHAIGQEEFEKLPEDERARIGREMEAMHARVEALLGKAPEWAREARARSRQAIEDLARGVVRRFLGELKRQFADVPDAVAFLEQVEEDLVERADELIGAPQGREEPDGQLPELPITRRYAVNIMTDHTGATGAPVIYEDDPTYPTLFGRIEHIQMLGALLTDFNLIKAGALHRANGGYLILDALRVLQQPFVWEGLKRGLQARELRIQSPLETIGLSSTIGLEPRPIPLDVKVVLVGDRRVHQLLGLFDPEFRELFKVQADFAEDLPWTAEAEGVYARLLAAVARRERTRPLDPGAVARLIEEAARWAEDRRRLSLDLQRLSDIVREADRWAQEAGGAAVRAAHVERALAERVHRVERVREEVHERIARGTILIDVGGEAVGQVNGLAVIQMPDFAFGQPVRITARTRLGKGHVVDVEREVELGGPIHSKGVLILEGFLASRYAADAPLSLSASLVFEQSYSTIEGDSASVAELCCLLSSLAEVPVRQGIAVTGSVNQHGQVQPVGGVDEKVEGFFDVCRRIGLTGGQGVVLPRSNLEQLMLRPDLVEAVAAGRFHVWAVSSVDEAVEVLTGLPAGERERGGAFPEGSVNHRVEARLAALAEAARAVDRDPAAAGP